MSCGSRRAKWVLLAHRALGPRGQAVERAPPAARQRVPLEHPARGRPPPGRLQAAAPGGGVKRGNGGAEGWGNVSDRLPGEMVVHRMWASERKVPKWGPTLERLDPKFMALSREDFFRDFRHIDSLFAEHSLEASSEMNFTVLFLRCSHPRLSAPFWWCVCPDAGRTTRKVGPNRQFWSARF